MNLLNAWICPPTIPSIVLSEFYTGFYHHFLEQVPSCISFVLFFFSSKIQTILTFFPRLGFQYWLDSVGLWLCHYCPFIILFLKILCLLPPNCITSPLSHTHFYTLCLKSFCHFVLFHFYSASRVSFCFSLGDVNFAGSTRILLIPL